MSSTNTVPSTHQGNLAKLPVALALLIERRQWCVWKWTQRPDGSWQKPPFMATQPARHASINDPGTWTDYPTALAAVQAGHADGITYVLTKDDPFGAIDLDHCRDKLCSIDVWAKNFMQAAVNTYQEVTPSGEGIRIWGLAAGDPLNSKYTLEINGKKVAAELFRRAPKALTVTGYTLDTAIRQLTNIDRVFGWAVTWGERRKAELIKVAAPAGGNGFDSTGCKYPIDQIEQIVREGAPAGSDRSGVFHAIIGHYIGCGWQTDRILEHLQQHPDGIGSRYLAEDRLRQEIERSAGKFAQSELPLSGNSGWTSDLQAKAPPEQEQPQKQPELDDHDQVDDGQLDDDDDNADAEQLDGDDHDGEEDRGGDEEERSDQEVRKLPRLRVHGEPDDHSLKRWLIKGLLPEVGLGILAGPWGVGKTFALLDLAASVMTGQPFLHHTVKRQAAVLLIAAEGADEVQLRLDAVVRAKCGEMNPAPFYWYEDAPMLLHKGSLEKLIAMAQQAQATAKDTFGLPLGLIMVDTLAACSGYTKRGDDFDPAVVQALMDGLRTLARALKCFVLGVGHLPKNIEAGVSGSSVKEWSADVLWLCLGERQLSGAVANTRLAIRKHRGGKQGQEYSYRLREIEAPEKDDDGDAITTMVIDWLPLGTAEAAPAPDDPWGKPKRQDQRTAVLRLKRVLMSILAEQGVDLPIEPDGPVVRMVDQKAVRKAFYACTPTDEATPEQKGHFRRQKFLRALDWAEDEQLIGVTEIEGVTYLRLTRPDEEEDQD